MVTNLGLRKLVSEINRLNPSVMLAAEIRGDAKMIVSYWPVDPASLNYPEGYYFVGCCVTNRSRENLRTYERYTFADIADVRGIL